MNEPDDKPDDKLPIRFEVDARDQPRAAPPKRPNYVSSPHRATWIAEINARVRHDHVDWDNQSDTYIRNYLDEIRHARLRLDEVATVKRADVTAPKFADERPTRSIRPLPNSTEALLSEEEQALPRALQPLPAQLRRRGK